MSKKTRKLFEMYYIEFRRDIFWYIYKKINKRELAEDMTADVFMKLLNNTEVIEKRDKNGVRAWLYTVSRNQVIDYYRKNSTNSDVDVEPEVFELIACTKDSHLKEAIKDEQFEILRALLEGLDPEEQEIIHLRFRDEMKFSEIAEIMDKKEGAIKMSLYRALEKIKELSAERLDFDNYLEE